jgi:iron(III) transport system substrate-binding protein
VNEAAAQLAEARRLAGAVPLEGKPAADKAFNAAFKDRPEVKSRLETEWDTAAKANYAKAKDLADQAAKAR